MVTKTTFGVLDGQEVAMLTLSDGTVSVEVLSFGATVHAIRVPDKYGSVVDICLGYETPQEYRDYNASMGGTMGRCANRIGGARFLLNGQEHHVTVNEGANCLHGGKIGFHKKHWNYTYDDISVTLTLDSPDGEEGFPGNVHVETTYTLKDGTLTIAYCGVTDQDTVVNLTNHAYFNLAGHAAGPVADHVVRVRASRYTPAGDGNVPTGEIAAVDGTLLDLRGGVELGERLNDPVLAKSRGYDHNFVLDSGDAPAAEVYCPRTGIAMEMRTTLEGMQLYTAGFLTERTGKDGTVYSAHHGLCMEPQHFPDAINHPEFPSPILRAGEAYRESISFRFLTIE